MRSALLVVALTGCGFSVGGSTQDPNDPPRDAPSDGGEADRDAGVMDIMLDMPPPPRTIDPATDWEMSSNDGTTWTQTALPDTGWGCNNCTRHYRVTVMGRPSAAVFRFASDNRARMWINSTVAFDQYWIAGFCTDTTCCTRCCDSSDNCAARLSEEIALDDNAIGLFTDGTNIVEWEVAEETGGEGFLTTMTVTY